MPIANQTWVKAEGDRSNRTAEANLGGFLVAQTVPFLILFLIALLVSIFADNDLAAIANPIFAFSTMILCGNSGYRYIKRNLLYAFTPFPWFYIACAVYFGFGPLLWTFGNYDTIAFIDLHSHAPIDDYGIFQTNLLSMSGVLALSVSMIPIGSWINWERHMPKDGRIKSDPVNVVRSFWLLLGVGGAIKYLLVFPANLGALPFEIPSVVQQLALLVEASIVVGFLAVAQGQRNVAPILNIVITLELLTGLMSGAKTAVIFALICALIGWIVAYGDLRKPAIVGGISAILYATLLSPFTSYFRTQFDDRSTINLAGFFDVVSRFAAGERVGNANALDVKMWWVRLVFSNFQKVAIDQWGAGQPGNSLEQIYWVFIPRIFYPDKPVIGYGAQFSDLLVTGSSEWTFTSMTWFAEGYWNFGPWGVILLAFSAATIFALCSFILSKTLMQGRLTFAILIILSIQLGLSVEAFFVQTFIGGLAIFLVYFTAFLLLEQLVIGFAAKRA